MAKKTFLERNERRLSLTFLAAVVLVWVGVFLIEIPFQFPSQPEDIILGHDAATPQEDINLDLSQSFEGCHIEYGFSKCIDSSLVTPFYNPGSKDLTRVSMYFYDGEDVDIYNCKEPLRPSITETLTTIPCTTDTDTSEVRLEWCCGDECSDANMTEPSTELSLIQRV